MITMLLPGQAIDPSLAGVITALVGGIVGVGGLFLNVVGKRDQNRQQIAADAAASDRNELDRTQQLLDAQNKALERADARERELLERLERKDARIDQLEADAEAQDNRHRGELAGQDARFREERNAWAEQLIALRSIVNDQIARAAGATFLDRPLPRPIDPPSTPDEEPDL